MQRWAIDIEREDIAQARIAADPESPLGEGEAELAVGLFAMTANNVTYAALGKPMGVLGPDAGYWDFFAERGAPGRLPVWGFARVTRSIVAGLEPGEEVYGYWPMASHARLRPERVGPVGFVDATPRRQPLPAFYNRYQRVTALDGFVERDRMLWPLFRPLQMTGWLLADQLAETGDYGANRVLVSAASSKTAIGLAHAYRARSERAELVRAHVAGKRRVPRTARPLRQVGHVRCNPQPRRGAERAGRHRRQSRGDSRAGRKARAGHHRRQGTLGRGVRLRRRRR
ncbi:DUF2855 family protein [Pyxidicoccus parkwayensis]|uniref:DUF2855 family protein n=1 Tax=Pyxidicoccus parkwayensis TaxID=2813578 RepID=A0ABX7P847_9BACT|nr:DUF2855 family protein [Pyxidicoccus parkwaysis]